MPRDQVDTAQADRVTPGWYGRRAPETKPTDLWLRVLAAHIRATTRSARSSTADFHNARP